MKLSEAVFTFNRHKSLTRTSDHRTIMSLLFTSFNFLSAFSFSGAVVLFSSLVLSSLFSLSSYSFSSLYLFSYMSAALLPVEASTSIRKC